MEPQEIERSRFRLIATLVALLSIVALVIFLMVVTGWGVGVLVAAAALCVLGVLHYLTWGRSEERDVTPSRRVDEPNRPWTWRPGARE